MVTYSFTVYRKRDDIYKDIAEDVETRYLILQIMNQIDHCLKKKLIGSKIDELGRSIMTKFVELRVMIYGYLIYDGSEDKKEIGTKKCVIKKVNLKIIKTVQKQLNLRIK